MLALVAHRDTPTNAALVSAGGREGVHVARLTPREALLQLGPGDAAVGRLDVRETLDGVDPGLWALGALAERGVPVLNSPSTLLTAHDKLLTARALTRAALPHPRTRLVLDGDDPTELEPPVVLKPRFGSWGRDVLLCRDRADIDAALAHLADRHWFRAQRVLAQELVPPLGYDLRIVVAGGEVVGAIERRAAPGEWRTNIALGGSRRPVEAPADACELALRVAGAVAGDLVGIDLLPSDTGWMVLELNGAVDFTLQYAAHTDVFRSTVVALTRTAMPLAADAEDTVVVPA
jgi:[lysine-biosynthesis-protein LysW]---L-2-aminoadipate ligase